MKRLPLLLLLLSPLACSGEANGGTLRTVLLIGLGVVSVVLLILFGRPHAKKKEKSQKEGTT